MNDMENTPPHPSAPPPGSVITSSSQQIPDGFAPLSRTSPFLELLGPLYSCVRDNKLVVGMQVGVTHVNNRGKAHGGVLATLADIALGYCMEWSVEGKSKLVTTSLSLDYAGSADIGDWVESRIHIQKIGARLAFANGHLIAREQEIVRVSGVFSVAQRL